jgi:hypothetical protein
MEETYVAQTLSTPPPPVIKEPGASPKVKWMIFILTVIVIAVILIFSGIYLLGQKDIIKSLTQNPVLNTSAKITPTATPHPTSVPTTNWNTYTSNNGSFSFKYPPDGNWKIASNSAAMQVQCVNNCPKSYNIYNFTVTKSNKTSLSQFISSLNTTNNDLHPYIEDYKFIKINGIDAVEVLIAGDPGSGTGPTVEVFIVIDGVGYLYSYTYLDPSLNSVTKLDQLPDPNPNILPTIITNGQTSTGIDIADWKVYTNNTQGVTLKYPANWFATIDETVKTCTKFSDSADFAPPHAHNVFTLCTYPDPVQSGDPNSQISLNGYQGVRISQVSNWGAGQKTLLSNPTGGSVGLELLAGDTNIYNLILSTFRFTQ